MEIVPLVSSLALVALAELGDKTQLAAITLSIRRSAISVFSGAILAFALVDGLSVLLGGALAALLPMSWISFASGVVFIYFGIRTLVREEEGKVEVKDRGLPLLTSFSFVALMELGDKTQFAVVALASRYNQPVMVFLGMMLAFVLVTGIGVVLGATLVKRIPMKYIRVGSSAMFLLFGIAFIISAFSGTSIF